MKCKNCKGSGVLGCNSEMCDLRGCGCSATDTKGKLRPEHKTCNGCRGTGKETPARVREIRAVAGEIRQIASMIEHGAGLATKHDLVLLKAALRVLRPGS